jgi:hypothetical protein
MYIAYLHHDVFSSKDNLPSMASENNLFYWTFVDLATKLYTSLWNQGLILVGRPHGNTYLDCHCMDKNDVKQPFQAIRLEHIIADAEIMKELLSYGYREAREEYIDGATR